MNGLYSHWQRFVDEYWEQRSWLTDNPPGSLDITAEHAFAVLCEAGAGADARATASAHRAGVPERDAQPFMPRASDGGWDGYQRRIDHHVGSDDWQLMINDFQTLDFAVWQCARDFLEPLFDALGGMPAWRSELVFVCGRYAKTPAGVHRDRDVSLFMAMLAGHKTMLTWPAGAEGVARGCDYEHLRDAATVLDATPGRLAYWPSSAWHVGESPQFSVSIHVALALSVDPWQLYLKLLRRQVLPALDAQPLVPRAGASAGKLAMPPHLAAPHAAMTAAVQDEETTTRMLETWMRLTTAGGFRAKPAKAARPSIEHDSVVALASRHPILVAETGDGVWSCSANGHVVRVCARGAGLRLLVEQLNDGQRWRVHELLATQRAELAASSRLRETHLVELLASFASWHALALVG